MTARAKKAPRHKAPGRRGASKRWSAEVTRRSNALDLKSGVFKLRSAKKIAASLKRSAEASRRRKGTAYQSAMSMLNFYINRAGRDLPARRKRLLMLAKSKLRIAFGREGSP